MLNIRHFKPTEAEYEAYIEILNKCWPDEPAGTIEEIQFGDREWRKDNLFQRFVLEVDEKMVGVGSYLEPYWLDVKDKYQFQFDILPEFEKCQVLGEPVCTGVEAYVTNELASRRILALATSVREDKKQRLDWLKERGFTFLMRYPISKLQVANFDFSLYSGHIEGVEKLGYRILGLDYLQAHDPDWHRKLYEAWVEIDLDVPSPEPPRPVPIEEFDKMFRHPSFTAESWAVAVVANKSQPDTLGDYAGVSANNAPKSRPDMWSIWLTGVCRAHRLKGLATGLKLKSIEWAKDRGVREIETGNEENNPIFEINMKFGFKPEPAWQDWEKIFEKQK